MTVLCWLQFPSLCLQYYKLVTFLAEIHADKFCNLAPALFQSIVASLEHGLLSYPSRAHLYLYMNRWTCLSIPLTKLDSSTREALCMCAPALCGQGWYHCSLFVRKSDGKGQVLFGAVTDWKSKVGVVQWLWQVVCGSGGWLDSWCFEPSHVMPHRVTSCDVVWGYIMWRHIGCDVTFDAT